jgi:hypothetical protein
MLRVLIPVPRLRLAIALLYLASVGACTDLLTPDQVQGTYQLIGVDGAHLPYVVAIDSPCVTPAGDTGVGHFDITAGRLVADTLAFYLRITYRPTCAGIQADTAASVTNGRYEVHGAAVTFISARIGGGEDTLGTGTLRGGVLDVALTHGWDSYSLTAFQLAK